MCKYKKSSYEHLKGLSSFTGFKNSGSSCEVITCALVGDFGSSKEAVYRKFEAESVPIEANFESSVAGGDFAN